MLTQRKRGEFLARVNCPGEERCLWPEESPSQYRTFVVPSGAYPRPDTSRSPRRVRRLWSGLGRNRGRALFWSSRPANVEYRRDGTRRRPDQGESTRAFEPSRREVSHKVG